MSESVYISDYRLGVRIPVTAPAKGVLTGHLATTGIVVDWEVDGPSRHYVWMRHRQNLPQALKDARRLVEFLEGFLGFGPDIWIEVTTYQGLDIDSERVRLLDFTNRLVERRS